MDSRSRLDYALFQLTPTRTRCDLVICAGDCKEKIASGLLAPFVAHLNFAKDEISKGGYSITLSSSASWFTKSTLERFVRFVSTPEVLERSITIEKEIASIDLSLNVKTPSESQSVYKYEGDTDDVVQEDDSKVHLQRVLKTRKTALQKEQAMVYARALVAGFETDNLEDLISFSDAFGSPRLREACINFMELCNTKSNDSVWMDEVAAMQAYSRSQYSYMETSSALSLHEDDDLNQELRTNVQNGNFAIKKQNNLVDMHTYQNNPMFHLPYQGYPFPPMIIPPYYHHNPPLQDFENRGKHSKKKESRNSNIDSNDSSSESDSDSSRKVIIRNINYINPTRDEETDDNSRNGDVNHVPDKTFKDKHEGEKAIQQWDMFQNLLLKDADDKDSENVKKIVSHKFETKTSTIGKHNKQYWFLGNLKDKEIHEKSRDIFEDHFQSKESTKDVLVDDSLVVKDRSLNKSSETHLRTQDIVMVSENSTQKGSHSLNKNVNEPNDLYMVLERDTSGKQTVPTWTPDMELRNNDVKIIKDSVDNKKSTLDGKKSRPVKGLEKKGSTIEAKSKALSERKRKSDILSRSNKPIAKGKLDKEEEKRKKMEELVTQRQKRIAERSASTINKSKSPLLSQDMNKSKKPVIRSSTINRLSTARVITPKVVPTESKPVNKPMKVTTKKIPESKLGNKPTKMATKKIVESKPTNMATKKIVESKPARVVTKKIEESKPLKVATKKISESKRATMATKKIGVSKPSKVSNKNIVSKNSNEPKKIAISNNVKQLPITTLNQSEKMENMKHEIKASSSSVLQEDVSLPINNGGSTKKSLHTVTFKINEDHGVRENPNFKMNHETPPMIKSVERNNSRKKWSSFETSSKALSGFKKLLSFGRRK